MVDIDFNFLFNINPSKYDQSNIRSLNPTNRVHQIKFKEKLEEYLEKTNLQQKIDQVYHSRVTAEEMNIVDKEIIYVLNAVRKYAEGPYSNYPYANEKQRIISKMKYIKALIRKRKGGMIDEKAMIRRKKLIDKEYDECTLL